ncbi:hypothetical protein FS837_011153 [Tulasnella sp. UAMH 9824]|nr:hypothetical protein FS837_011153 [Tulasnella sp. UAMH 9824]
MASVLGGPGSNNPSGADPTPPVPPLMLEGACVVFLDDQECDFAILLDTLLPQTSAENPISSRTSWTRLLGLAKIAQKYQVNDVVVKTVACLEKILPTVKQPAARFLEPTEAIRVIDWARQCSFTQFLPMAFYYATTTQWELSNMPPESFRMLRPQDGVRIQQGRARLQAEVMKAALTRWENSCHGCIKPEKGCPNRNILCWTGYGGKAWDTGASAARWTNLLLHPVEELLTRVEDCTAVPLRGICGPCCAEFIRANSRMLQELVSKFESIFSLNEETAPSDSSRT